MGRCQWREVIGLRRLRIYFSKPVIASRCRSPYDALHMSLSGPLTRSHLNESSSPLCAPTPVALPAGSGGHAHAAWWPVNLNKRMHHDICMLRHTCQGCWHSRH